MTCKICSPVINGIEWRTEIHPDNEDQSKVTLSVVAGDYGLNIYPNPYKAHKFFKTYINFCPYCGEDLKPKRRVIPKILEVEND